MSTFTTLTQRPIGRRRLLMATGAGVTAVTLGGLGRSAYAQSGMVRWVSPRGTLEVLDDYPYWVAKKYGYFGGLETDIQGGPMDATATIKLVDQGQADMGYPSPGVFSLGLAQGIPLTSVFQMGAYDVFDFAFQKGKAPADLTALAGKTVVLGSVGWSAICAPMFAAAGVDPASINYVEAGAGWAQSLSQGQADAALSWEGLRAQWTGQGLDFDYLIGRSFSKFPANSFVIRKADFDDPAKKEMYEAYLKGWAMGLEFGHQNPRGATHLTMGEFPALELTPEIATESLMQLANVFRGDFEKRQGWGWHDMDAWALYLKTVFDIGQVPTEIAAADVIKNDYVAGANAFDAAKVKADADAYELPAEYTAVDVETIRARL